MMKPLSVFIGLRYLRAKRQNHFISFISLISMMGIALGVTTLITVISVMNGFEKELRSRILGAISHATIQPLQRPLDNWRELISDMNEREDVIAAAPYIEVGAWLQSNGSSGALVRGVDPAYEATVSEVATSMVGGSLDDLESGEYGIVLGIGLAVRLRVGLGDKVTIIAPRSRECSSLVSTKTIRAWPWCILRMLPDCCAWKKKRSVASGSNWSIWILPGWWHVTSHLILMACFVSGTGARNAATCSRLLKLKKQLCGSSCR